MLTETLITLSNSLSDYLIRLFKLNDEIVCVQSLRNATQSLPDNKVHISLINIERETTGGIQFNRKSLSNSHSQRGAPSWQLNLYVMIAAVFSEKQYEESLQFITGVLLFLQNNNSFNIPQLDYNLAIEPVNLSFTELSNIWSINGSNYHPSIVCKIRLLNIDANEIKQMERTINQKNVTL